MTGTPLVTLLPTLPCLRNLALEACHLDPSFYIHAAPSLTRLKSLKLTHPGPRHPTLPTFFPALETLLQHTSQLKAFTLYYSGASTGGRRDWPTVSYKFIQNLTESVGKNLRKFEVSGVLIDVDAVQVLLDGSRGIKDLVLHLGETFDLVSFAPLSRFGIQLRGRVLQPHLITCFHPLSELRTLHILSQRSDVTPDDVLELAEQYVSSDALHQHNNCD